MCAPASYRQLSLLSYGGNYRKIFSKRKFARKQTAKKRDFVHINSSHHYGELFENKFCEERELDVCERCDAGDCVSGFWRIKKARETYKTGKRLMEKGRRNFIPDETLQRIKKLPALTARLIIFGSFI